MFCRFSDKYIEIDNKRYFQEKELIFDNFVIRSCNLHREFIKMAESNNYLMFYDKSKNGSRISYYMVKKDDKNVYHILDRDKTQNLCPDEIMCLQMYINNNKNEIDLNLFD